MTVQYILHFARISTGSLYGFFTITISIRNDKGKSIDRERVKKKENHVTFDPDS